MQQSMGRGVADADLRVWTPQGAQLLFVRQVSPTVEDLTDAPGRGQPAHRRLPDRLVGRRVARLPRGRPAGRQVARPGAARRPGPARGRRRRRRPGAGQGQVVRRRGPDHPDQPRGRALHRADRAGRGDPGGPGRQGGRRRGDRDHASSAGPSSSPRPPATTRPPRGCARWSTSTTPTPARYGCKRDVDKADEMALDTASTKTTRGSAVDDPGLPERPHSTSAADYCDVCGAPIDAGGAPAPRRRRGRPAPDRPAPAAGAARPPRARSPARTAAPRTRRTRCSARPAATTSPPAPCRGRSTRRRACRRPAPAGAAAGPRPAVTGAAATPARPAPARTVGPARRPGAGAAGSRWVAEVWVDPAWYEARRAPTRCPRPGCPTVVPLRRPLGPGRPGLGEPEHPPRRRLRPTTPASAAGTPS